MTRVLDITQDVCPMTFVKVKMALSALSFPGTLSVRLRGEALKNVIASLKAEGHRVVGVERQEGFFLLTVEKGVGPT